MNIDTKLNLLMITIIIMSVLVGVFGMRAYDNNRINNIIEYSTLKYYEAVEVCQKNYYIDAELKELNNKFVFEIKDKEIKE